MIFNKLGQTCLSLKGCYPMSDNCNDLNKTDFNSESAPTSSKRIESQTQLISVNPGDWPDEKFILYRDSLHQQHTFVIQSIENLKKNALGLISATLVSLTIICAYLFPKLDSFPNALVYKFLCASVIILLAGAIFSTTVLVYIPRPGIVFSLDNKKCDIQGTVNIAYVDEISQFKKNLLRYEIHTFQSDLVLLKSKSRYHAIGIILSMVGIVLAALSLIMIYNPGSVMETYAIVGPTIVVGLYLTISTIRESKKMKKAVEDAEKENNVDLNDECKFPQHML